MYVTVPGTLSAAFVEYTRLHPLQALDSLTLPMEDEETDGTCSPEPH